MIEELTVYPSEQALLGILFVDSDSFSKVSFLNESDFYARQHAKIFQKMRELNDKSHPISMMSVEGAFNPEELEHTGGFAYFADLAKNAPSAREAVYHADKIKDMASRREAFKLMDEAKQMLMNRSSETVEVISSLEDGLDKLIISSAESDILTVDDLIGMSVDEMERSMTNARTGLSTGIDEIDERLGYKLLAFGEVTALGALSKNGKTLTANTILARARYEENETAHVFSIEMPAIGMFNGIVSALSGVPSNFYARQEYYSRVLGHAYDGMMAKWGKAAKELNENGRITIDGKKQVDADYICANMKKQYAIHRNKGKRLRLVVIDHLHRMDFNTNGQPLTYAIRDAMRKIKNTAADLDIAVLALCQLNNSAEDKDPTSFHILDSSSVRHEMQAFIGTRIFKQDGETHVGIYGDSQRYGDMDTKITPAYMKLKQGVLNSLGQGEYFTPAKAQ